MSGLVSAMAGHARGRSGFSRFENLKPVSKGEDRRAAHKQNSNFSKKVLEAPLKW